MKKLSLILIFALLCGLCACGGEKPAAEPAPAEVPAETETEAVVTEAPAETPAAEEDGIRWSFADGTLTVRGSGCMEDYEFLNAPWDLAGNSFSVEKLVVEEGVSYLSKYAFSACCNLSEVELPSTLRRIGAYCFADCGALRTLTLPKGLLAVEESAFSGCGLVELKLPEGLAEIGECAFTNCIDLLTAEVPESLLTVGDDAFLGCGELTVELPRGAACEGWFKDAGITVKNVGAATGELSWSGEDWKLEKGVLSLSMTGSMPDYSPVGAYSAPWLPMSPVIERVELTDGVTSVGDYSFWACPALKSVYLPEGIERIGDYAFGACGALEKLELPSTLKTVGYGSFSYCTSLTSLTLPEGLETVGVDAFARCSGISDVEKPASLKNIGAGASNFAGENTGELTD